MITFQTGIELPVFLRRAKVIMTDTERVDLLNHIAANPEAGVSLERGLRKVRIPNRGGYRTICVFGGTHISIFRVAVFAKNEKDNLSNSDQAAAMQMSKILLDTFGRQKMSAHDSIMRCLNEALAFARDKDVGAQVHNVNEPLHVCRRLKLLRRRSR